MSAIYGIINKNGKPLDPEMLQKMKQALLHRAKDGSKELICDNAAFGFCNLVVYPNQEHEQLPIQDGDLVFTANAHLHNRDELLTKLGFDKLQYSKTPDSYLILEAFKKWGVDSVHHLDGEYVYAIWNKLSNELFISNDHIGFKSVYYYDSPEQFIFCSEIKGIEAVKTTPNYFDGNSLVTHYYVQGDQSATYNRDIKKIINATVLRLNTGKCLIEKYWNLKHQDKYRFETAEQWYDCIRHYLYKAVESRLTINKNVGVMLSGGLDSSTITCILSEILKKKNQQLYTFSAVLEDNYSGKLKDESNYIDIIHKHCDNLVRVNVSANNKGPFDHVVNSFEIEEIIPDKFHYMDIAIQEAASEKGISLLYSGFGGDFYLSAKGRGVLNLLAKQGRWKTVLHLLKKISAVENISFPRATHRHFIANTPVYRLLRPDLYSLDSIWNKNFINQFSVSPTYSILPVINSLINKGRINTYLSVFDTRNQFYSMEAATPLFDRKLMEVMADIPLSLFLKGGHLRSIMHHTTKGLLPSSLQFRKTKSPYVVDHFERMTKQVAPVVQKLSSDQSNILYDKFFNRRVMKKILKELDLVSTPRPNGYKVCFVGISEMVIQHLMEKKYIFE